MINYVQAETPTEEYRRISQSRFFVDKTLIIKEISREDLRLWYNGYCTVKGTMLYNPRSVVCALADNQISNYRTSSGPYDEICQIYSAMVV